MTEAMRARLQACDAVVAWCVRNAARRDAGGDPEQAALWCYAAAVTASQCGHSWLCSAPLERQLLRLAARIAVPPRERAPSLRWLHVLTTTTRIGGHTALARRWIARNPLGQVHDIAVTAQPDGEVDASLVAAARASGGRLHGLASIRGMQARASALRALAFAEAEVVVLHAHPWDVLPALAFGVDGGPPVALMNHADHAFWVGTAVADTVIDFRASGAALTARLRSPRGSARLPLPLDAAPAGPHDRAAPEHAPSPQARAALLAALGDPDALASRHVMLTIGRAAKYQSRPGLDWFATLERILASRADWALVAVGPDAREPAWQALRAATGGRVFAVGEQGDLAPWLAGADLYVEGFPIGSYTALLEAARAGLAVVRKPLPAPPAVMPVDAGALADFAPPADAHAYVRAALALMDDSASRSAAGTRARSAIEAVHGAGWPTHVRAFVDALPTAHRAGLAVEPAPLPDALADYVAGAWPVLARESPLEVAQESLRQQGLWPRTEIAVQDAVRAWRAATAD